MQYRNTWNPEELHACMSPMPCWKIGIKEMEVEGCWGCGYWQVWPYEVSRKRGGS